MLKLLQLGHFHPSPITHYILVCKNGLCLDATEKSNFSLIITYNMTSYDKLCITFMMYLDPFTFIVWGKKAWTWWKISSFVLKEKQKRKLTGFSFFGWTVSLKLMNQLFVLWLSKSNKLCKGSPRVKIKFSVSYIARKHLWKMHKLSFELCSEHCCTIEMDWNMLIFWENVYFSVSYHIPFQMQMRLFRQALISFLLACTAAVTKSRPQYSRSCTGLAQKAGNTHYYWHIQIHASVVEIAHFFLSNCWLSVP